MGVLDRIAKALATADPRPPTALARAPFAAPQTRGAYDPARLPDWFAGRAPDWSPWDDRVVLADAVGKCTVVFACATYLADAVAESPLEVYRIVDGEPEPATDRAGTLCRDLLSHPNPYASGSEFFLTLVLGMCVWGYGVVEKVRATGAIDLPVELWTLRPDWLARRPSADGRSWSWEYPTPNGGRRPIADRDLLFVPFYPDPWRNGYGVSPAQVAAREIGIDSGLTDFLKTFLDAGGIPPFVLTYPEHIGDQTQVLAMQEQWRSKYGGTKAYGALPVLHGGFELKEIGGTIDEFAWPDLRGLTEQKIAQAHRIPLELLQGSLALKGGPLTSTQFEGAMAVLQRYAAAPLRARIDGAFTRGVLAEFTGGDPSYDLAFDVAGILAMQEDTDALHERIRANWQAGLVTLNEARQDLGMDGVPDGDVFSVGIAVTLTPADALIPGASAPPVAVPPPAPPPAKAADPADAVYRDLKALPPWELAVRSSSLARSRRDRAKLAEIGTRELRRFWREQGERIAGAIAGKGDRLAARAIDDIDWDEEERRFRQLLLRFYGANGEAAFAMVADTLAVAVDWTLANPNAQRVLADLAKRIVRIADATRGDVRRIVGEALKEGVAVDELASRLTGLFARTYANRAETVARTESQVAYNSAAVAGYAESGLVDRAELFDNPDHDEDYGAADGLSCAARNGLVVPLGAVDLHIAAEHPNGSLAISPVLIGALGD